MTRSLIAPLLCLMASACGAGDHVASAAEKVVYQTVNVPVPVPCPVHKPARPAPLARPLPTDPGALVDSLLAKLKEWNGPGKYADQAEAAIDVCTRSKGL